MRAARLVRSLWASRWLGRAGLLLGLGYLGYTLVVGVSELGELDWRRYAVTTVVAFFLYPISLWSQAVAWALGLHLFRRNRLGLDWRDVRVFASSHLMRRLPGGVWHLVARVSAYREDGGHARAPVLASLGEVLVLVAASALVYVTLGPRIPAGGGTRVLIAILLVGALSSALGPALARTPWPRSHPEGRNPEGAGVRSALAYLAIGELYVLALMVGGGILWLYLLAGGASEVGPIQATATWAAVAGVGAILGLVPGIIAVREVTLFFVLGTYLPAPAPAVIAILFRLLFVAADLVWGSALLALARRMSR